MKNHNNAETWYLSTVSLALFEFPKSEKRVRQKVEKFWKDKLQYFINLVSTPHLIDLLNQTKTDLPMHFRNFPTFQYNFISLESSIQPMQQTILKCPDCFAW